MGVVTGSPGPFTYWQVALTPPRRTGTVAPPRTRRTKLPIRPESETVCNAITDYRAPTCAEWSPIDEERSAHPIDVAYMCAEPLCVGIRNTRGGEDYARRS